MRWAKYIPNALRSAPGHLNDKHAIVYKTPPLDDNDPIATTGQPLTPAGAVIDATGGWWEAGDYMKFVETTSYPVALQEIGVRDFPNQMGSNALRNPVPPLDSIFYAGHAYGAPSSPDLTHEAGLHPVSDEDVERRHPDPVLPAWGQPRRLPQTDDDWQGCDESARFICHRAGLCGRAGRLKDQP